MEERQGDGKHVRTLRSAVGELEESASGWERHIAHGLQIACVPTEIRAALATALGEAGVEAEFFLALCGSFPLDGVATRARGAQFLLQLEAAAHRLRRVAASLEIATQGFLAALARGFPEVRATADVAVVWWPAFPGFVIAGEPLELRLRRCGFAFRHVVRSHLVSAIEAIAEQMALTLHALGSLPPAGVVPASALYLGLYEFAFAWQGNIAQHHLLDTRAESPGLFSALANLRALDCTEDTSVDSDLAWAAAQLAQAPRAAPRPADGPTVRFAHLVATDWRETILALSQLRARSAPSADAR